MLGAGLVVYVHVRRHGASERALPRRGYADADRRDGTGSDRPDQQGCRCDEPRRYILGIIINICKHPGHPFLS